MKFNTTVRLAALMGTMLVFGACAGPSHMYKDSLHGYISAGNYQQTEDAINAAKQKEYGKKNAVLYYLDLGMVQHDAGQYRDSDRSLAAAEDRMEELYTKSVSRALGTLIINDNTTEYAGEPFDRALTNVFRALDYVFLDDRENALVEARKVTEYLTELAAAGNGKSGYRDDAFAQYLSGMLFEDGGQRDDARISYSAAQKAYSWYASDYKTPLPSFDINRSDYKDKGEVVVLHYNGIAPVKVSKTFQVAWDDAVAAVNTSGDAEADDARVKNALNAGMLGNAITVAYPEYTDQPFSIAGSEVWASSTVVPTRLMEDVSAIAKAQLDSKVASQRLRMIARATIKYIIAKSIEQEAEQNGGSTAGLLAKMVTSVTSAATEVADTRCWATLPAQIRMARIMLPPGKTDIALVFRDASGAEIGRKIFAGVDVQAGKRTYLHYRTAN